MTIIDRALELLTDNSCIGLGSGRAAAAFVRALGQRVREGRLRVRGVPTSEGTAALAQQMGVPLTTLDEAPNLDLTVDGADEVDPQLNLIKGYGRALVREKIVAAASRQLVILVGQEKLVPSLGSRRRLPVEVVPFGLSFVTRRVTDLGLQGTPAQKDGRLFVSDNGNHVLDLEIGPNVDARGLEASLRSIPGVVGTGFFLGMADVVLIGTPGDFVLVEDRQRDEGTHSSTSAARNTSSPVESGCSREYP